MSKDLGHPLARGRTADIYAWQSGYVLKLFHDWFTLPDIEYEARIGRAVHAAGLPVPLPVEIISVAGHNCLVYERIDGPSMAQAVVRGPWLIRAYALRLTSLHARLHASSFGADIPSQRLQLESSLRKAAALPEDLRKRLLAGLHSLPDGSSICHGDLHPGNVLVTPHGDMLIDWENATLGNPLADVARSSIIMLGDAIAQPMLAPLSRLFHSTYVTEYFRLRPAGADEYRRWLPIMAAARLNENIPRLANWLLRQAAHMQ